MLVKAAPGTRCPKEGNPRVYITDQTPEEVPDSAYYIRLVADGSLIPAPAQAEETGKKRGGK
jgi:hypothetical protein